MGFSYDEIKKYIEFVFYRVPKDNHELLLQVRKRLIELLKKEDVVYNCFGLDNVDKRPGFINISRVIPINADE